MLRARIMTATALLLAGAVLLTPAALAQTQVTSGNVTGVITDPSLTSSELDQLRGKQILQPMQVIAPPGDYTAAFSVLEDAGRVR